jgi:hypothetical protein
LVDLAEKFGQELATLGTAINLCKSCGKIEEFRFEDFWTSKHDKTGEVREKFCFCF